MSALLPPPLNGWAALLAEPKTLFGWPDWQAPPVAVESKRAAAMAGRSRFVSHEAERCRLHVLLMDHTQASLEGVQVCLMMWRYRPGDDMSALLMAPHEGKSVCISRVDVRPASSHVNRHWRRFQAPAELTGSHVHPFAENATLGRKAFEPYGNLPHAVALDAEPEHLREFLQIVEKTFNINGLIGLPPPPTQESMI